MGTLSHGDLRGDNFFLTDSNEHGWLAIDFQLMFKGPIPSDLAYLMNTGSADESAYKDGEDEILQMFYDEFQKHTKKYKTAVYPFAKFKMEYVRMLSTFSTYGTAMGGAFVQSGK